MTKPIDHILHRLTIFYYIFLVVTIASVVAGFSYGLSMGMDRANQQASYMATFSTPTMVVFVASWTILCIASVWMIVLFIRMIITIGRSIRHKDVFDLRLVKLIHRFVILYTVTIVCAYVNVMTHVNPVKLPMMEIMTEFLSAISTVVILLIFCEVLKIGHILKAEQELTI